MYAGCNLDNLPQEVRGIEYEVELAIFLLTILETYPADVGALADVMAARATPQASSSPC